MLKWLLGVFCFGDLNDKNDRTFFFAIGPRLADVFVRKRIVILQLRVGTARDDAAAHLRFGVRVVEIDNRERDARVARGILALVRTCGSSGWNEVALPGNPY